MGIGIPGQIDPTFEFFPDIDALHSKFSQSDRFLSLHRLVLIQVLKTLNYKFRQKNLGDFYLVSGKIRPFMLIWAYLALETQSEVCLSLAYQLVHFAKFDLITVHSIVFWLDSI